MSKEVNFVLALSDFGRYTWFGGWHRATQMTEEITKVTACQVWSYERVQVIDEFEKMFLANVF